MRSIANSDSLNQIRAILARAVNLGADGMKSDFRCGYGSRNDAPFRLG